MYIIEAYAVPYKNSCTLNRLSLIVKRIPEKFHYIRPFVKLKAHNTHKAMLSTQKFISFRVPGTHYISPHNYVDIKEAMRFVRITYEVFACVRDVHRILDLYKYVHIHLTHERSFVTPGMWNEILLKMKFNYPNSRSFKF